VPASRGGLGIARVYLHESDVTEEFDAAGKMKERKEKVYRVSFENGRTRAKLMEVNGRPPAEADVKKQADNEMTGGQLLGQPKSARGEQRENFLTAEVVARSISRWQRKRPSTVAELIR